MPILHASRNRRDLLPVLAVAAVLLFQTARRPSPFDDAFITFRYARNIASGIGFVYNAGQPVLGSTTPLFTSILALIGILAGPMAIPIGAFVVAVVADCISAWLLFRLAERAFADRRVAFLLSVAFVLAPFRLAVSTGGMEASLFTALVLLAFDRLVVGRALVSGSLAAALSLLARPEALVALAPIFAYLFLRDRSFAVRTFALVTALVVPWVAWATITFGSPVPHSVVAKANAYQFPPGFAAYFILSFLGTGTLAQYAVTPLLLIASFTGLGILLIGVVYTALHNAEFTPLVIYAPLSLTIMTLVNAPMFFPWYFYPLLPSLIFAVVSCFWYLPIPSHRCRLAILALAILILTSFPAYLIAKHPSWPLSREREAAYREACKFLQATVSPGDVVLAPDIGVIGWCLPDIEILDPIGLVSPRAVPYLTPQAQGPAIPQALVRDLKPAYIVALKQYVAPFLLPSAAFSADYSLAWSRPVTIAGRTQDLVAYRRSNNSLP